MISLLQPPTRVHPDTDSERDTVNGQTDARHFSTSAAFEPRDDHARPQTRSQHYDEWSTWRPEREWPAPALIKTTDDLFESCRQAAAPRVDAPILEQRPAVGCIEESVHSAAEPAERVSGAHQAGNGAVNRRAFPRAAGPFDGRRIGALETPIKIYDLSVGGCFINSMHEQQPGVTMVLKIDLPDQPSITVTAQSLYSRVEFGFGAMFINVNSSTQAKLEQAVTAALAAAPKSK